jgi:glycine amidinotransferase
VAHAGPTAPRPQLPDELYDASYRIPGPGESIRYIVNEFEPVFDAEDVARCGRDLFVTGSNVTNQAGIRWLRRHLDDRGLRIHELESRCGRPMHIDSTFVPLGPGKVLVNPDFINIDRLPPILKRWEVLIAPRPDQCFIGGQLDTMLRSSSSPRELTRARLAMGRVRARGKS